jgi:hypothetical protein
MHATAQRTPTTCYPLHTFHKLLRQWFMWCNMIKWRRRESVLFSPFLYVQLTKVGGALLVDVRVVRAKTAQFFYPCFLGFFRHITKNSGVSVVMAFCECVTYVLTALLYKLQCYTRCLSGLFVMSYRCFLTPCCPFSVWFNSLEPYKDSMAWCISVR